MRILLCTLDAPGMLYPTLRLGNRLRSEGHSVALVTGLKHAKGIADRGLNRIPRGGDDGPSFRIKLWANPAAIALQFKHVAHAIEQFDPDVIVGQMLSLGVHIAAEAYDRPLAVLGMATYLWPRSQWQLDTIEQAVAKRLQWRLNEMMKIYNSARSALGLQPLRGTYEAHPLLGDAFLVRSAPHLETRDFPLPAAVRCVGPLLAPTPENPTSDLQEWLSKRPPETERAYVQFGPYFDRPDPWANLMQATADRNLQMAASIGRMDRQTPPAPTGHYVARHVPQEAVLPTASIVISTGHSTATLGMWTHGVPGVLIPSGSGSPDIARRCQLLGVAVVVEPNEATATRLGAAIDRVLNDARYRERASEVAASLRVYHGFDRAVRVITALHSSSQAA